MPRRMPGRVLFMRGAREARRRDRHPTGNFFNEMTFRRGVVASANQLRRAARFFCVNQSGRGMPGAPPARRPSPGPSLVFLMNRCVSGVENGGLLASSGRRCCGDPLRQVAGGGARFGM